MLSLGPFPWESNPTGISSGATPVICHPQQAARWYWLHRRWTLDINITFTVTGENFINGSAIIEWNRRTMDGKGGPPTAKEQLPAGYQMVGLLPLGFVKVVQVEFFSPELGGAPSLSGVQYDPDLSTGFVRPFLSIFSADATNPLAVGTAMVQDGDVTGSIDGAFLPISAPSCTGHLTMDPYEDWVYP